MKQKVLALVLACLMLLSVPVFAATYSDVPETHDRYQAINMLSSMDIITGFPDGSFKPDDAVTRAQMAALITRMFNLGSSPVTAEPFSDVTTTYWAASDIVSAKNRGIINGFPDGTFQPEAEVTYEQAVKMIVCALNYGAAAEKSGGYPGGYIQQASKLGIMRNAMSSQDKPAPRGIIAQLLYNSLEVDMLVPQVNADGTVDYVKSETGDNSVSQQFLKTETLRGVTIVRTPRVNLEPGTPAIENVNDNAMFVKTQANAYVKITVPNESAFEYIGQQVDVTYKVNGEDSDVKTLTNLVRSGSVRVYENIKLSDVISISTSGINYYTNKINDSKNNLSFNGTPVVIYNERLHSNGIAAIQADLTDINNVDGVVSVYISGNATLVKVKSYKTYVVEKTNTNNETITVKGNVINTVEQSNFDIYIPYKETHINETVIRKGNFDYATGAAAANASKLTSYSGIAKGNIIAVAKSESYPADSSAALTSSGCYCEVLVSSTTVSGIINEYTTDDATNRPIVKISTGASYLLATELNRYEQTDSIQAELDAKFHIDPFGEIGYVSNVKTTAVSLGLPVSITSGGSSGFDRVHELKIYNVDTNAVQTLRFYEEESGDSRVAILKDLSGNLITDSLFKYTLKNGQIDTLGLVSAPVDPTNPDDYDYVAANSAITEVDNIKKTSSTRIEFDGKSITYNTTATKIILIGSPSDTSAVTPKTTSMTTNTPYTGKVYQLNLKKSGTNYNMQYVIIRPFEGLVKESPVYIVESVGTTQMGAEGNIVTIKVYPFNGTAPAGVSAGVQELVLTESVKNALQLKKGDVFAYYSVPNSSEADIATLKNVYILARADEIAKGSYPTAGTLVKADNMETAGGYNADYRYMGIVNNTSNLAINPSVDNVFNYYLGTALEYVTDEEDGGSIRNLRMAKDSTSAMPILPGDTAEIAALEAGLAAGIDNNANFFDYSIANLTNIFVYNASASESEKLIQVKGKDAIREYLEDMQTIANNISNPTKRHDTLFVRTYTHATNGNTFYNMYIIKDAR